jgi:hypothetical protein
MNIEKSFLTTLKTTMSCLILLFLVGVALSHPNTKALIWPAQFQMQYITPGDSVFASSGTLSFSSLLNATRIDHSAGAYECVHFYNETLGGCTLFMSAQGLSRVLHRTGDCCIDEPNIASTGRDWMVGATYAGEQTIGGRSCFHWSGEHDYFTATQGDLRRPCAFTFPPAPQQNMQFLHDTWRPDVQLSAAFMLPPAGCTNLCNSSVRRSQ